jgi:hypothetical protein
MCDYFVDIYDKLMESHFISDFRRSIQNGKSNFYWEFYLLEYNAV